MSVVIHLPEELAGRLSAAALARGVTAEQLAVETIEQRFGIRPGSANVPSFIGIGASASVEDAGRRHREIIREAYKNKTAQDV